MNLGRPMPWLVRTLAGPMSVWVRRAVLICCVGILWGAAWMPFGNISEENGWILLAVLTIYTIVRRSIRFVLRHHYAQRLIRVADSERYRRGQLLLVFLTATSSIFCWPLRVSLFVQRPFLNHFGWYAYAKAPMLNPPKSPRMVGLFLVTDVALSPRSVTLEVNCRGSLRYYPEGIREQDFGWIHAQAPWYLRWVVPPSGGKWVAIPDDPRNFGSSLWPAIYR
jgi:hypothetical protein